jgi:hypothetical protein
MSARAVRWICARCEVSAGRIDGGQSLLPDSWTRLRGLPYCLSCSRADAAEAASNAAPDSISGEDRMRLKRRALIAFEIDRVPAASDRAIANACRTSAKAVANVREEMSFGPVPTVRVERLGA